ncbi:4Fe-4S binding protein [Clostridium sp. 1001275B_160808_H3]|uniref:4Fe-4S binding protein n=1 Tax=Clostridium sp. 1001275B_160808_H3 TaxID=2787110 RepID=UPI001897A6CF|nr:4Fe-4S binding protein [Clostridium sp. 1001275B_160808_H3]
MIKQIIRKKAYVEQAYSVAYGLYEKCCPLGAISVYKGIYAQVDFNKCVGCSKCAKVCPASIIEIKREVN